MACLQYPDTRQPWRPCVYRMPRCSTICILTGELPVLLFMFQCETPSVQPSLVGCCCQDHPANADCQMSCLHDWIQGEASLQNAQQALLSMIHEVAESPTK